MAGWKNDKDIFRDMNTLSGIQSSEENIKSYSSWGRGQNSTLNTLGGINLFPETQEKTDVEEFQWFPEVETVGKLPDSIGRGKKLEILKANLYRTKEMEVHEQVREVMGPGYSNAYIEESFNKRLGLKIEHKNLPVEQFQDLEEVKTDNCDKFVDGQSESSVPKSADSAISHEAEVPKHYKSHRRKLRNAALESIERMKSSENKSVEEHPETGNSLSSTKTGPMFGIKSSNIPPACYLPGKSCSASYSPQETENLFVYKESDFPNL